MPEDSTADTVMHLSFDFASRFSEEIGAVKASKIIAGLDVAVDGFESAFMKHPFIASVGVLAGFALGVFATPIIAASIAEIAVVPIFLAVGEDAATIASENLVLRTAIQGGADYAFSKVGVGGASDFAETLDGVSAGLGSPAKGLFDLYGEIASGAMSVPNITSPVDRDGWGSTDTGVTYNTFANDGSIINSQVATTDASSVSTIVVYSGPNGTGTIRSKDIEHPDNTSEIITYGPSGPTDDTTYGGPDGTGIPGAKVLTVYDSMGHAAVEFAQSHVVFAPARVGGAAIPLDVPVQLLSDTTGLGVNMSRSTTSPATPGINGEELLGGGGLSSFHPTGTFEVYFDGGGFSTVSVAPGTYNDIIIPISVTYGASVNETDTETVLTGSAKVYEPAQETASIQPVPHIFHVGDTASLNVSITNIATGDLTDSLHTVFLGSTTGVALTNTDPLANLAGGESGALAINVDTSKAGDFSIDSNLFPVLQRRPGPA